jgi:hypothetical protein
MMMIVFSLLMFPFPTCTRDEQEVERGRREVVHLPLR